LSSDSHVTALEDARERYGAASQPEKEERLRIRREWYGAASQLLTEHWYLAESYLAI